MAIDLPPDMAAYTFVHGQPCVAMGVADDIAADGTWVRLRYRCSLVSDLLRRIAVGDTITVDCALFAQLVVACIERDERCFHLGTGAWAMKLLAARHTPTCVLALPKALYDAVKCVNHDAAQYLVGPDTDGKYLGLAKTPMRATLHEWREHLCASFLANTKQQADGALKLLQLEAHASGALRWNLICLSEPQMKIT